MKKKLMIRLAGIVLALSACSSAWAGSIFLTGHDPDFHATSAGAPGTGAQNINNAAIDFILDPAFNSFFAGGINKFLFVESNIGTPPGHRIGKDGIVASGFVAGMDFEQHNASTLNAEIDLLGSKYSGIVIASDFGGLLTQAELDILNARSGDIISFLNADGGLYAMAESNNGTGLTPGGGHFGFLPFVVSSTSFNSAETGITVTPFGASLGLVDSDVNSNFSHNVFDNDAGLNVVDTFPSGQIVSIAGRIIIQVPEPASLGLLGLGLMMAGFARRMRSIA